MKSSESGREGSPSEGMATWDDGESRVILFSLAGSTYGLPLGEVREVSEFAQPKAIPGAPEACLGILNVRGDIVTVVELRSLWGLVPRKADAPSPVLLLVDIDGWLMACVADAIEGVCRVSESAVEPLPHVPTVIPGGTFRGLFHSHGKAVVLLDLAATIRASGLCTLGKAS